MKKRIPDGILKRMLSLVMALVMILSVFPWTDVSAEESAITVYFRNNWNWTDVKIHYWGDGFGTNWPGEAVTLVENDEQHDIYKYAVPAGATGIIFNGTKEDGSGLDQTPDITGFADGDAYEMFWDGSNQAVKIEYTPPASGGETPPDQGGDQPTDPTPVTVTVHFRNADGWTAVNSYAWNADGSLLGSTWPGDAVAANAFNDGWFTATVTDADGDGSFEIIFNEGQDKPQTGNLKIDYTTATEFWVDGPTASVSSTAPEGWLTSAPAEPDPTPVTVTVHFRNADGWTAVNSYAWNADGSLLGGAWPGDAVTANAFNSGWFTAAVTDADGDGSFEIIFNEGQDKPQTGNLKIEYASATEFWVDGPTASVSAAAPEGWLTSAPTDPDPDPDPDPTPSDEYQVTFHFADTLGWGGANLYTWQPTLNTQLTGGWPGKALEMDENGFYSHTVTYTANPHEGMNFIFNGGGVQTIDLNVPASDYVDNKAEKWVVLTDMVDGKYQASILNSPDAIVISPVVQDNAVTFKYYNETAQAVSVAGSFNEWNTTATPMVRNDKGVWSVEVSNLSGGIHQYKFIVDGQWVNDPANSWLEEGNNAFHISDPTQDVNKITINIQYTRSGGDYEYWNVSSWNHEGAGRHDFQEIDGKQIATITLDSGRTAREVRFKVRKSIGSNEWAEQHGEVYVNLSNVLSGTINVAVNGDTGAATQKISGDVVYGNKVVDVQYQYETNEIAITTNQEVADPAAAFTLTNANNNNGAVAMTLQSAAKKTYTFKVSETLDLRSLHQYNIRFNEDLNPTFRDSILYPIKADFAYNTDKFTQEYTYTGKDLGASLGADRTTFRVWAPTATDVDVKLYATGSDSEEGACELGSHQMTMDTKGTWTATVEGNLRNIYYTYAVTVDGETVEAVDPYARATGVNGKRAMLVDLDATDPAGWASDTNPNPITSYTDAVIYELHVRDFSIDDSSGVSDGNQGKFLAFTEAGTTVPGTDISTGIDYLDELGVTHLHLLPIYDYGSVDETKCENFNWGYDPVNYNVPEGSYSTNPYDGNVRINEMKQMIMSLHEHDISVIMDVVYNHVYNAEEFCYNKIVPDYFSRVDSNASGCGNDTASERAMVRKYIVESVLYWAEEYHIDGFRFDLVGLLDVPTIQQIVTEVHKVRPDIIFYGEGWDMDGTNQYPEDLPMAKQGNASQTPGFAYFSDNTRDTLSGRNGQSTGFVSGLGNVEADVVAYFKANPWWTNNPNQVVQYVSCHDNYTLADKLVISTGKSSLDDTVKKMSNLSAAMYMTSQGIPFIHAGEEMFREKLEEDGGRCENSYNASDEVNKIRWDKLKDEDYAANAAWYQGLIAFRKAHAALRLTSAAEITNRVIEQNAGGKLVSFWINGQNVPGETHDSIYLIFNANTGAKDVTLPEGDWDVCITGEEAGTAVLSTVSGTVSVPGISAMILVQEETKNPPAPPAAKSDWALPGSFNGWNGSEFMNIDSNNPNGAIMSLELPAGNYEFKIKHGNDWYGSSETITDTAEGLVMSASVGDNCKLTASGGTYTFAFDGQTKKLTVTYTKGDFPDPVVDESGIQDGRTLHCWNWSFAEIEKNMATIAQQGYTAIQTSPVQALKEPTNTDDNNVKKHWWVYYQPVDFVITTDSGNALGTKAELQSMIAAAHQHGVKVIVDVVANHLANKTGNDLSDKIPEEIRNDPEFWHDIKVNSGYTDRYDVTQNCMGGLPDLNTANKELQNMVLDFLKECVDLGVDGFRFDAAKHIETPMDDKGFASDFWPTVIQGAEAYAKQTKNKDLYMYGEILNEMNGLYEIAYTQYMAITDNVWSNSLRSSIEKGNAALRPDYIRQSEGDVLVLWAESHDTYATDNKNESSMNVSQQDIIKTWALVAARAEAMALYLARPENFEQDIGVASKGTGWDDAVVKAINEFDEVFAGTGEYVANEGSISYVERGEAGVVLVQTRKTSRASAVTVTAHTLAEGDYVDQITGEVFTVKDGSITGKIGESGVAVVYNQPQYTVTVTPSAGGTVTASPAAAIKGETITLTVTPGAGKVLRSLTVTDAKDRDVTVTDNTFTMPGSNVTVTAVFENALTVVAPTGGTLSATPEAPAEGATVTITVRPNADKQLKSLKVKNEQGGNVTVRSLGNGVYTFTMPAGRVQVSAEFENIRYDVILKQASGGTISTSHEEAEKGTTVTITAKPDSGKRLSSLTVKDADGKKITLTKVNNTTRTFQMPDSDVTVTPTFGTSYLADTGDDFPLGLLVAVMALSLGGAAALILLKNKKKK